MIDLENVVDRFEDVSNEINCTWLSIICNEQMLDVTPCLSLPDSRWA